MKMHNWIFRNGTALDITFELSRLTAQPPERLVEAAAFIEAFRPHDVRFATGDKVWSNGQFTATETTPDGNAIEIWMSTEFGDHIIPVNA